MLPKVLCSNPHAQYLSYKEEILSSIQKVCDSGSYILGPEVEAFEKEFSRYNGAAHCIGVGSGTDALILSLKALNIASGDEVITVLHTALATISAILAVGAIPVLVDIEEDYYTLDPNLIEDALSDKTKAIIPVHLYGQPCDMDRIMEVANKYGLKVIEDCAQAHGAKYKGRKVGTIGDVGCFSFYPTKNLGAIGDGGGVITNDPNTANRLRRLRQYGWDESRIGQETSAVTRLDELQAAILSVKLKYLNEDNERRKQIASQYGEILADSDLLLPLQRPDCDHVYHLYVVRSRNRDRLMENYMKKNIIPGIHYSRAAHNHPGYRDKIQISEKGLVVTEKITKEILSLPMYPELLVDEYKHVFTK